MKYILLLNLLKMNSYNVEPIVYASIYIPRVSAIHTEMSIKTIMMTFKIGIVKRIDFTPINKKQGFRENVNDTERSVFIHFSDRYIADDNLNFNMKTYNSNNYIWNIISSDKPYKINLGNNEFWICLKNKNIVQHTMMNIHQVVENGRYLENLVEEQQVKIEEQQVKIEEQHKKIEEQDGKIEEQKRDIVNLTKKFEGLHNTIAELLKRFDVNTFIDYVCMMN